MRRNNRGIGSSERLQIISEAGLFRVSGRIFSTRGGRIGRILADFLQKSELYLTKTIKLRMNLKSINILRSTPELRRFTVCTRVN